MRVQSASAPNRKKIFHIKVLIVLESRAYNERRPKGQPRYPHAVIPNQAGIMQENSDVTAHLEMEEPVQIAIVGLNRETASLLPSLMDAEGILVIKVMNPDTEDLSRLTLYPQLSIIIDTTHNPSVAARLQKLPLKKVDVISGLGARLLFCRLRNNSSSASHDVLSGLEEIREAVCLTKNTQQILQVILNTSVKTSGADCGSLMLLDPSKRQMTIEAAYGIDQNVVVSSIQRVGQGISGIAVRRGEPILIQGAVDKKTYAADYHRPEIVSSICCPLMSGDEAIGVINIASKNPNRIFSSADVESLLELASLTAEVIKGSRDSDTSQHSAYKLSLINSVHEILSMKYRFEERLNLLLMKMANAFGAKVCTYYEFNPVDRGFLAKASSSVGVNRIKEHPMRLDPFYAQRVLKTGSTFCVNSTGKTPRSKKWYMLQPIHGGAGQNLVGTLFIYLQSEKNHLKEETVLLRKIGAMLTQELSKNKEKESVKAQSLKYSAISQFTSDVANTLTLPELTQIVLSNVGLIFEADSCVLRLRNSPTEALEVHETLTHRDPAWLKDILIVDEAITSDMAPGDDVLRIEDLSRSDYEYDNLGGESVLVVAIEMDGEILGTLSLYGRNNTNPSHVRVFSEQDKDALHHFGLQTGKGLKRFFPFPTPVPKDRVLAA